jgi:hypothetical protein
MMIDLNPALMETITGNLNMNRSMDLEDLCIHTGMILIQQISLPINIKEMVKVKEKMEKVKEEKAKVKAKEEIRDRPLAMVMQMAKEKELPGVGSSLNHKPLHHTDLDITSHLTTAIVRTPRIGETDLNWGAWKKMILKQVQPQILQKVRECVFSAVFRD